MSKEKLDPMEIKLAKKLKPLKSLGRINSKNAQYSACRFKTTGTTQSTPK
jgi:hypothetical protein